MTQVWERLFIGGIADAEELADDNPDGITAVISLSEVAVRTRREDVKYFISPLRMTSLYRFASSTASWMPSERTSGGEPLSSIAVRA
jgi:hypothetical protein